VSEKLKNWGVWLTIAALAIIWGVVELLGGTHILSKETLGAFIALLSSEGLRAALKSLRP
jgi:hypothetical protein